MCIHRKHGGQRGYKGHVINFPQTTVKDLPILTVRHQGADNTHKDFKVRRARVLAALRWLKRSNPCYKDITIDLDTLATLPVDGVP